MLLNVETLLYFSLNRTGAALWLEIDRTGNVDFERLVQWVCERFDVDQGSAEVEIVSFVEQLNRLGLVQLV